MYQHEKQQRLIELDELGITFGTPIGTVCPSCSRSLDAFGMCPCLSQEDARRGLSYCCKTQDDTHPESCSCTRCYNTRKLLN
jgi:hypothetical protein